ncbi:MAG: tetratricopeptide repeat protein [Thermoguttaceae bacterium]|jgi:hypothetical protein
MWRARTPIRVAALSIGLALAWSVAGIPPVLAQRGGGHGGGPGGGGGARGGPTPGPGVSRGGAGPGAGSFSRGGSSLSRGGSGISRGGSGYSPGGSGISRGGSGISRGGSGISRGGSGISRGGSSISRGGSSISRGGSSISRGGSSISRGGSGYAPGGVPHGGSAAHARPQYDHHPSPPYHGGGRPPRSSSFYFYPYSYGYGYSAPGLSLYFGLPFYRYYDYYYDYYPYYSAPYYPLYTPPAVTLYGTAATPSTATISAVGPVVPAAGKAAEYQRQAEQAFRERRYEDAARLSNHAIVEDSQNGKLHLFASQTFFALGDFQSAAAAIEQAASLLDRGDWGFVVENYQKFYQGNDYVAQTDKLLDFIKANPDAPYAYLLLGYHYLFLGHKEAARENFSRAVKLESRDRLAAELLAMAGGPAPAPVGEIVPTPAPAVEMRPPDSTPKLIPPPPPPVEKQ